MADSTWKTYKTAVESFQSFRKLYNLQDTWPAPLYDLLFYIAYMSHTGLSASTITTYISGISTMHKLNGHTDNTKSFLVTKILEGSKRKNSPKADLRLPVSMNLLKRLIQSLPFVCTSVYESTMFASAFSLCFFGLLRVGEITSQSKGRAGKHVIHISDIKLVHKQDSVDLHLMIRSSKTDQHSHSTTLIICSQTDNSICPVHLLKGYLEVRQHALDSNLYLHFDGSDLTRYQFSIVLQRALSFCEVKGHFRPHSFRIGAATEDKRFGIHDDVIKKWGRWTSDAYTKYIRLDI